ncbi:MAG TPA: SufS family cysteine desulfurase [Candidatus Acidoferrales bacterium]|nr:SufS family cysteine desulfurase [Candidatus Acidoferrales bacterium]
MKNDFPIFKTYPDLVYLDSSATSQKPQAVIDAVSQFYSSKNANIHRGIYDLSQMATDLYENTRKKAAGFIGVKDSSQIIFTTGATEALNMVAFGWAKKILQKGDIIVLSEMEHHANIVPWQQLKKSNGVELYFLPLDKEYRLDYKKVEDLPAQKVKLLSLSHISNVLGTVNPLEEIIPFFKKKNPEIKVCIDAAQSVPHFQLNVEQLDCDFLTFSSHKMLGPAGVGVLYARKELLEVMDPLIFGGSMITQVTKEDATWAEIPDKFEAGTRNTEGVAGFGAAIDYLHQIGFKKIQEREEAITRYALEMFGRQKDVRLFGPAISDNRIGVFSFAIANVHPHDVAEILNRSHIAVRTGHHCAMPLMKVLGVFGTARASFYLYNTREDIDRLQEGIEEVKKTFNV